MDQLETICTEERTVPLHQTAPEADRREEGAVADEYLDRRGAERVAIECPIKFQSEEQCVDWSIIDGALCDLSKTGCKVYSLRPPAPGHQITLVLALPDGLPPLWMIGSTVRHVQGRFFGVEFLSLTPNERRRLQAIIFKYITWSVYSLRRPAFQFADPEY
jgi:hypothetical protein